MKSRPCINRRVIKNEIKTKLEKIIKIQLDKIKLRSNFVNESTL